MTERTHPPTPCYVFDIDGTLADLTHRLHFIQSKPKDWEAFKHFCFADKPIPHMIELCRTLWNTACTQRFSYRVILMSGRNECQRAATQEWLERVAKLPNMPLYMRADLDYRDDSIIKQELLQELRIDGYEPIMAFDDRSRVVNMWRANGVPCAQVAPGDF